MGINYEKDAKVNVTNEMLAEISNLTARQIMLENEIKNHRTIKVNFIGLYVDRVEF